MRIRAGVQSERMSASFPEKISVANSRSQRQKQKDCNKRKADAPSEKENQYRGPDDVELLLDRKRPKTIKGAKRTFAGLKSPYPIGEITQRIKRSYEDVLDAGIGEIESLVEASCDQDRNQRWAEPSHASKIELPQVYIIRDRPFANDQACNQKPTQDEKYIDT